jgi:hypothetical protein
MAPPPTRSRIRSQATPAPPANAPGRHTLSRIAAIRPTSVVHPYQLITRAARPPFAGRQLANRNEPQARCAAETAPDAVPGDLFLALLCHLAVSVNGSGNANCLRASCFFLSIPRAVDTARSPWQAMIDQKRANANAFMCLSERSMSERDDKPDRKYLRQHPADQHGEKKPAKRRIAGRNKAISTSPIAK